MGCGEGFMWRVSFVVCCEKEKWTRLGRGRYKGNYYVNKRCEVGLRIIKMLVCIYVCVWVSNGKKKMYICYEICWRGEIDRMILRNVNVYIERNNDSIS